MTVRDERWRAQALCLDTPPDLFFPAGEDRAADLAQTIEALDICDRCPVQEPCLNFALETRQEYGVWGGTTEKQRRNWRKTAQRRRAKLPLGATG